MINDIDFINNIISILTLHSSYWNYIFSSIWSIPIITFIVGIIFIKISLAIFNYFRKGVI